MRGMLRTSVRIGEGSDMANEDSSYPARIATLQNEVLEFLRAFEAIQENLRPGALGENQARMVTVNLCSASARSHNARTLASALPAPASNKACKVRGWP